MKVKEFLVLACLMILTGTASSQSYVLVSGSSYAVNSRSNLMLDYDLSSYDPDLEPGDTGTLTLVIKNTGTQTARNVEVNIPDTGSIRTGKRFYLGSISQAAPVSVSMNYQINKNASLGINNIPVRITYDGYDSDGNAVNNIHSNYEFPIQVYGRPKLSIRNLEIGDVRVGEKTKASIVIENQKSRAYNAEATLITQSNLMATGSSTKETGNGGMTQESVSAVLSAQSNLITILGSDKVYIGEIGQGEAKKIEYYLYIDDTVESGAYSVPLTVEYENKGHQEYSETFNLGLYVSGEPSIGISNVKTDPEEIHADDEDVEVKVTVENTGTMEVKNLKITLKPEKPLKSSKSYVQTKDVGILKPSEESVISFYVDVEEGTEAGEYGLNFQLDYQVGTKDASEIKTVPIVVKESPEFELTADEVTVGAGESSRLDIKVSNTGAKCDSVTVWALKKSDHPFDLEDKSEYIGDLGEGESGEAVIEFTVDEDAKHKKYILPLEIRCTIDDMVYISTESAVITVNKSMESTGMSLYLTLLVVAAVGVYVGYRLVGGIVKKSGGGKHEAKKEGV